MQQHVIVVPFDKLIIVDGVPLRVEFPVPESLHALQWHDGAGHTEWTDGPNRLLALADYAAEVAPYVAHWEREKARLAAEAVAVEEARLAVYNSTEARAARVRAERDRRLTSTNWLVERHAEQVGAGAVPTLTAAEYTALLGYRQALRDIPQQDGFPWTGPDDPACPWPVFD